MLRQRQCTYNGCTYARPIGGNPETIKKLFDHEISSHGECNMSSIEPFIVLARQRRVILKSIKTLDEAIFVRMEAKLSDTKFGEILQTAAGISDHTPENLRKVLAPPSLAGFRPEEWEFDPTPIDDFLINIAPMPDPYADWRKMWTNLRSMYASGEI